MDKYRVFVNGEPVVTQEARVSKMPFNRHWPGQQRPLDQTLVSAFASFEAEGEAEIRIKCEFEFEKAVVRPLSYGIIPKREGNTISFCIDRPCQTVVEFDGMQQALHLFADPCEEKISLRDTDLYFGPGEHNVGRIVPSDGQTVYIDKGAVVFGEIYAADAENVTIAGRGILDHSKMLPEESTDDELIDPTRPSPIVFMYSKNIVIKDIIVRDPCFLAVRPIACEDVVIDNIKIIGCWRYNSDGIDLINTKRGIIRNCFVRSFDDSICLKGFHFPMQGEMFHNHKAYDAMEDITVENCVVWNDWGHALHIGIDLCAREVKSCTFRNCDIIHSTVSSLNVSNVDYAEVYDILYEDIRVEYDGITQEPKIQMSDEEEYVFATKPSYMPKLINAEIRKDKYSCGGTKRGKAKNISFKDISIAAPKMPPSVIAGYSDEYPVDGVILENITLNGRKITDISEMNVSVNEYAKNIVLK